MLKSKIYFIGPQMKQTNTQFFKRSLSIVIHSDSLHILCFQSLWYFLLPPITNTLPLSCFIIINIKSTCFGILMKSIVTEKFFFILLLRYHSSYSTKNYDFRFKSFFLCQEICLYIHILHYPFICWDNRSWCLWCFAFIVA